MFAGPGSWPEARESLVQFLMERNGFRFITFKKACATQVSEVPADEDLKKLLAVRETRNDILSCSQTRWTNSIIDVKNCQF